MVLGSLKYEKKLVYNHDTKFTAQIYHELWCILGTKTSDFNAFHPQSDGQSECTNHTFDYIFLVHIHNKLQSEWLDALPCTEFAIISTISQNTGYSPFAVWV